MIDAHHAGFGGSGNRACRARGTVDDRHLAEELALAKCDDDGLGGAADLGDLDQAVQHDIELAARGAFLENDVADIKLVDAFLDRHDTPMASLLFWLLPKVVVSAC
jgi:hypothetical protein